MTDRSFFAELRKRKVLQAAAIYGAIAWGVTEVVVTIVEQLFLAQWVSTLAVIFFVVGFPVAMFLAWTFDFTAEGIRRTKVTSRRGTATIAASLMLLVAGTTGLFFLIKPGLQVREEGRIETLAVAPNSVAVLPFSSAGVAPEEAYLVEGLSDELRDQLARVTGLRIAARLSSVAVIQQGIDAIDIAGQLGVAHLVDANVRRQGNVLKVSVQLIEGASGLAVWSQSFERGPRELLSVQQAIAEAVVAKVLPKLGVEVAQPATRDPTANDLLLLARHYDQQVRDRQVVDRDTLLEAIRLYRQAINLDPESPLAHSRLAGALLYLGDIEAAEAPIFRALSLNSELSEVQNTLGEFYWARGIPGAMAAFARAVELNPNNVYALQNYAALIFISIEGQEINITPDQLYRRAMQLDPLSISRHAALGDYLGKEGRVDEVTAVIAGIEQLFDGAESYRVIAWLHELIGEVDHAIAWTIRARDLEPGYPDDLAKLADLYATIGDFETALQLESNPGLGLLFRLRRYQDLIDMAEFLMIEDPNDVEIRYLLSFAYVAAGQFDSAIHVLSSTGLPGSMMNGIPRSVSEIEAFTTLMNALAGAGTPESIELAESLAIWQMGVPWWGDIGWLALFRSCNYAIQNRHDEALQLLPRVNESVRLLRDPLLRDSWCFQQYREEPVYLDVLGEQDERRALVRERLPATLAEFGVSL